MYEHNKWRDRCEIRWKSAPEGLDGSGTRLREENQTNDGLEHIRLMGVSARGNNLTVSDTN